jgi:type VII secretion integral membrane protein EccD
VFGGGRHTRRAGGACRITVVGSRRRVDLVVPATAPIVELLPQLVQLTGEDERPAARDGWLLTRVGGDRLDPERSLREAGVVDGELLYLDGADRAGPPVVEDFTEAVADVVEASGAKWTARRGRRLLEGLAGAVWLTGAAIALTARGTGDGRWAVATLAVAAGLDAAGAVLTWWLRRAPAGAVAVVAALPFWAVGGASLASVGGQQAALAQLVAAAAATLVAAGAGWIVASCLRRPAAALVLALAPLTAAGAAVQLLVVTPVQAAAAVTIVALAALPVLPGAAAGAAGLMRPRDAFPPAGVEPAVSAARRLLAWLLLAAGVDLAAALAVLGLSTDAAARALCAGAIVSVALRARHHRFAAEVLPLALAAAAGALLLEIGLTASAGPAVQLAVLLATGAALAAAAWLPLGRPLSPHARRWVSRLEVVANATLVPLALAAAGVFAAAADVGHRLASA